METITIKLDENMLNNIDKSLSKHNYSTRTEFIRDAIRKRYEQMTRDDLITEFMNLKVHRRTKRRLSDKEWEKSRQKAFEEYIKEKGWDLG